MLLKMFHRPKPRQYSYTPVYYNPKEDEKKSSSENQDAFRSRFREKTEKNSKTANRKKTINVSIYLVLIILLIYLIFFS